MKVFMDHMNKKQLRRALQDKGMPTDGFKTDLKFCLQQCLESEGVDIAKFYIEEQADGTVMVDQVNNKQLTERNKQLTELMIEENKNINETINKLFTKSSVQLKQLQKDRRSDQADRCEEVEAEISDELFKNNEPKEIQITNMSSDSSEYSRQKVKKFHIKSRQREESGNNRKHSDDADTSSDINSSDAQNKQRQSPTQNNSSDNRSNLVVLHQMDTVDSADSTHTYYREFYKKGHNSPEQQAKPRSKKRSKSVVSSTPRQNNVVELHRQNHVTSTSHDSSSQHTVITAVLQELRDDIVPSTNALALRQQSSVSVDKPKIPSESMVGGDKVYVQKKSGFSATPRSRALEEPFKRSEIDPWLPAYPTGDKGTPLDSAVVVQMVFTLLSRICFGLLGGVALFQLIAVQKLLDGDNVNTRTLFLGSYSKFAEVMPIIFYVLLSFCIVSIFDRFDLAHLDLNHFSDTLTYRHSWIVVIIYSFALLVTLWCTYLDNLISSYTYDKSVSHIPQLSQLLWEWEVLNLCRCFLAIFGWIIISLTDPDDLLLQHLKSIKQYENTNKQQQVFVVQSNNY